MTMANTNWSNPKPMLVAADNSHLDKLFNGGADLPERLLEIGRRQGPHSLKGVAGGRPSTDGLR
jgi:hypothetical protein